MEQDYITDFVNIDVLDARQFELLDTPPEGSYKVIDNFF